MAPTREVEGANLDHGPEGELYLDTRRVAPENLEEEVRKELERLGSDTVLLRGDVRVMLSRVVDVMATLKRAGAYNLGLLQGHQERRRPGEKLHR